VSRRSAGGLLFAVGTSAAAAGIGSLGSRRAPQVYPQLDKPKWAPPAAVFGPAWTTLYTAIGIAGWRLWTRDGSRTVLGLHVSQLAFNAAWPFTFFTARNRAAALAVIAALDVTIAAEIVAAARRDRLAAALLAPYLAWSLYATALTVAVSPATSHDERELGPSSGDTAPLG
jgi:benzodiazapine receptor